MSEPKRRIWPVAIISLAACGGVILYARWGESASRVRLERLTHEALVSDFNQYLHPTTFSKDEIRITSLRFEPRRHNPDFFQVTGTLTVPRKTFRGTYFREGDPTFPATGTATFDFEVSASRSREAVLIARQLGPIRPTWRILYIDKIRKPKGAEGMPIDTGKSMAALWPQFEEATFNDLFDFTMVWSTMQNWWMEIFPDSFLAIHARVLRSEGDPGTAADLLISHRSRDAYKAPLVRGEVERVRRALGATDPYRDEKLTEVLASPIQ